jgi:Glyoxalase superfamily protein
MTKAIPVLRIFDYAKAIEFYIDWLEFTIDWEHTFEPNTPIYMQISKDDLVFHLSEHHGDASPGAKIFIENYDGLKEYHSLLISKNYKYNRPGLDAPFYNPNGLSMEVNDPFNNRLIFNS